MSIYPVNVGGGRITNDDELLASCARTVERLIPYAHSLGTVATDDRDQARSLLEALRARVTQPKDGEGAEALLPCPSISAARASATGWAIIQNGQPLVKTVSPTRIAALVNGLLVIFGQVPLSDWTDARIEEEWGYQTGLKSSDWRFDIERVTIVPAGDRS